MTDPVADLEWPNIIEYKPEEDDPEWPEEWSSEPTERDREAIIAGNCPKVETELE